MSIEQEAREMAQELRFTSAHYIDEPEAKEVVERAADFIQSALTSRNAVLEKIADRIVLDVAELPDRTSPDDWPEAMLVTGEELHWIVLEALKATPNA